VIFVFLNFLWGWNRIQFSGDFQLYGWLAIANAGLALLMGARSNVFSHVLRIPSDTLLLYHRWIGRATFIHATIHMSTTVQQYVRTEQLATVFENTRIRVGMMCWVAVTIIFLSSLSFIRRRFFEVFYYAHLVLFLIFIGGALYHASFGVEFMVPGLVLWGVDRMYRLFARFRTVTVTSVTHYPGDLTKIKFRGLRTFMPGQIAWIQIPSVSQLNWHPFTIASAPGEEVGTIAMRGLGGYTKRVQLLEPAHSMSDKAPNTADDSSNGMVSSMSNLKIRLDGPYKFGHLQWDRYPVIVLVAGGIGVTPAISIASYIVNRARSSADAAQSWHIHMLWTVKSTQHSVWFEEELSNLAALAADPATPVTFDLEIHATRHEGGNHGQEEYAMETSRKYNGPGTVHIGRPNMLQWFQQVQSQRRGMDAAVSVCGPRALMDDGRKAASKVSWEHGLFYVSEEEFER